MNELTPPTIEANTAPGEIPLDLASALSPWSKHPGLSLRVERLPAGARLSRGHNNGDRSWSLSPDDLGDLTYLPPPDASAPHTLSIKVIGLDDDSAATLAQFDLPVTPGETAPAPGPDSPGKSDSEADRMAGDAAPAEVEALQDELARLSTERETALADLAAAEETHARELTALRERRAEELRLQTAEAETRLAREVERQLGEARAAWESEIEGRNAAAVQQAVHKAETDAGARLQLAREGWKKGSRRELAAAQARYERAETALVELGAHMEAGLQSADDTELCRLQDELEETGESLAAREAELKQARLDIEQARQEGAKTAIEAKLAEARRAWEAELQQRLADADSRAAVQLADSRSAWQAEKDELLAGSEARTQEAIAEARKQWRRDADAALEKAAQAWKAAEAARLAAAEARWQEQSEQALAESTARFEQAEAALIEARAPTTTDQDLALEDEVRLLRVQLAAVRETLSTRESELTNARAHAKENIRAAVARAEAAWKAGEALRLAAARKEGEKQARVARTRGAVANVLKGQRYRRAGRGVLRMLVLAGFVAGAVVFYPRVEPVIVDRWWPEVVGLKDRIIPWVDEVWTDVRVRLSDYLQVEGSRTRIDVPLANVRAGPSTATPVNFSLARNAQVTPLERRGDWVLIRLDADGSRQGWVHRSLLKEVAGPE